MDGLWSPMYVCDHTIGVKHGPTPNVRFFMCMHPCIHGSTPRPNSASPITRVAIHALQLDDMAFSTQSSIASVQGYVSCEAYASS